MIKSISIIGKGALGTSLYEEVKSLHYDINIFGRGEWESGENLGDLVILCVDDKNVGKVATQIVDDHALKIQGRSFIHCSGSLDLSVLSPIEMEGGMIGAIHPIQTFVKTAHSNFKDVFVSIVTENNHLYRVLNRIFDLLGGFTKRVNQDQKMKLHASAVFASNFIVSMIYASQRVLDDHNLGLTAKEIFKPLYKMAVENISDKELVEALSGPAKRGEIETLKKHQELLAKNPELLSIYTSATDNLFHLIDQQKNS